MRWRRYWCELRRRCRLLSGENDKDTGVTGLSDRDDAGECDNDTLESVDEVEGGRPVIGLEDATRFGAEMGVEKSGGVKTI